MQITKVTYYWPKAVLMYTLSENVLCPFTMEVLGRVGERITVSMLDRFHYSSIDRIKVETFEQNKFNNIETLMTNCREGLLTYSETFHAIINEIIYQ